MRTAVPAMFLLVSAAALSHPGHGAPDLHSHAWDAGLIAAGILAVIAIVYFVSRKK